jgi:hypothetical protein
LGVGCSGGYFGLRWTRRQEWRRLHKEELHDPYSPNTRRVVESRTKRWEGGYMACMADSKESYRVLVGGGGNLRERDDLDDIGVYRKIILKWIF